MINKYKNIFLFIKELSELKNHIVILPSNIDEQLSYLTTQQLKNLKRDIKRLNIKILIEKEQIKNNQFKGNLKHF